MKKLLLICALLFAARAQADDEIEPFGGLDWNDDVLTVITKINKIDGMKHVVVGLGGRYEADVSGVTTREAASAKLDALLRKAIAGSNPKARQQEFDTYFDKYQTKDKKTVRYWKEVIIRAESVLVAGVLYHLTATMNARPGLQVTEPKNVFVVKGTNPPVAEPLTLDDVRLRPMASNTAPTDPVREALDKKYHFAQYETAKSSPMGSVRFNSGSVYYKRSLESEHKIDNAYSSMLGGAATEGKADTSDKF